MNPEHSRNLLFKICYCLQEILFEQTRICGLKCKFSTFYRWMLLDSAANTAAFSVNLVRIQMFYGKSMQVKSIFMSNSCWFHCFFFIRRKLAERKCSSVITQSREKMTLTPAAAAYLILNSSGLS